MLVLADVGINLAIRPLQVGVGHQRRPPVPGAGDVEHVQVVELDDPVQVDVEEILAGRGSPVTEQARLDMLQLQRLLEERVVHKVDLSDGQVVGGTPVGMHLAQLLGGKGSWRCGLAIISNSLFDVAGYCSHKSFLL